MMSGSGQINTIDDLMRATYEGSYALQVLSGNSGMGRGMAGQRNASQLAGISGMDMQIPQADLLKADDPFLTTKDQYFNPIYGRAVIDWLNHESDVWKLLPKSTYQAKGDSWRVLTADATNFYGQLETAAALGDTDIPDLTEATFTDPAVMYNHWDSSLIAQLKSTWQDSPAGNAANYFRDHFAIKHPSDINAKLLFDTDTPASGGGNFDNYIESIDRVCSDGAESALLSAATDNDIYGFDRSANEAEAYVDLNAGALRNLTLGLIDDMVAECKKFSESRRFIILTDETQLNTIEGLDGVKQRYSSDDSWKISTQNGVQTRNGYEIGFSVSSIRSAGIKIPIFTSKDIHAESGGSGNIYLLDLDHIDIRVALPTVYMGTQNAGFLLLDSFNYKYMYLTIAQLTADKFACHGAIKYLN